MAKATVSYHLATLSEGTNLLNTLFHKYGPTTILSKSINNKAIARDDKLTLAFSVSATLELFLLIVFSTTFEIWDELNIL